MIQHSKHFLTFFIMENTSYVFYVTIYEIAQIINYRYGFKIGELNGENEKRICMGQRHQIFPWLLLLQDTILLLILLRWLLRQTFLQAILQNKVFISLKLERNNFETFYSWKNLFKLAIYLHFVCFFSFHVL